MRRNVFRNKTGRIWFSNRSSETVQAVPKSWWWTGVRISVGVDVLASDGPRKEEKQPQNYTLQSYLFGLCLKLYPQRSISCTIYGPPCTHSSSLISPPVSPIPRPRTTLRCYFQSNQYSPDCHENCIYPRALHGTHFHLRAICK
jgi:hypothetical protein